jgi:hypothetical protein
MPLQVGFIGIGNMGWTDSLAKFACGDFADTSLVAGRQRRDFAGLLSA